MKEVGPVAVSDGQVTIEAKANTAYVLYPSSSVPAAKEPNWGQGSNIVDPGFFSGTLDAYRTSGEVSIETSNRVNLQALLGAGPASLEQDLAGGNLPAGTYNASAWVEIAPPGQRAVSLSVSGEGVKATALQPSVNGVPTSTVSQSFALNATASDEKLNTYFQRVRVTFTTTGGKATFAINAGEGDTPVRVDDLRLVPFTDPTLPQGIDATKVIAFEDFEHPDAGYWPFVTGISNRGGDARTQLAERHAPYSQAGWWGKDSSGAVVEGFKLVDNVLDGQWSLQSHEENPGLILRTTPATVPFKAGHDYKVSMKYQNGLPDTYRFVAAFDSVRDSAIQITRLSDFVFPSTANTDVRPVTAATQEFSTTISVGSCGSYWFGIEKIGAGYQADLTLDNIVVEDLGPSAVSPACADLTIVPETQLTAGRGSIVQTLLSSAETSEAHDVTHTLTAPDGWSVVPLERAAATLEARGVRTKLRRIKK